MAVEIPFLNSDADARIFKRYHRQTKIARVSLMGVGSLKGRPRDFPRLWLDPAVDGYDHLLRSRTVAERWRDLIEGCSEWEVLAERASVKRPDRSKVRAFVDDILGKCLPYNPRWLTVPQLPVTGDRSRNRVNRMLAEATYDWKEERRFRGKLVLPLVFTHMGQLRGKTQWSPKLEWASKSLQDANASIVWTVDSSLPDDSGSGNMDKRLSALVGFHEDLRETFPEERVVAGPYWGMNLVLWVRRLCDQPAVSLGSGYRYHVTGARLRRGKVRIVIPPIRRRVVAERALRGWLNSALRRLSPEDPARPGLVRIRTAFSSLSASKDAARNQVGRFYSQWLSDLEALPPSGRALGLFQDLSSAFVLGRQLPQLPKSDTPRDAAKVAQQLMVNCL